MEIAPRPREEVSKLESGNSLPAGAESNGTMQRNSPPAPSSNAPYNFFGFHPALPPLASCRLRLPALSAVSQVTGMVGLLMHYQMLYGSIVYFFSFFNTNR